MQTPDKRLTIVFNGEIFNYRELRTQLLDRGHQFRTHSDTEVIVHAYEEWGDATPEHLNGQFAFAEQQGFFHRHTPRGIQPLHGDGWWNHRWQNHRGEMRTAPAFGFGQAQPRVVGRNTDVARQRQFQSAAIGVAIDRGDHRLHGFEHHLEHIAFRPGHGCDMAPAGTPGLIVALEITAGTKRFVARAGDDYHPYIRVKRCVGEGLHQPLAHRIVHRVACFGTVQRDVTDAILNGVKNGITNGC